MLRVLTITACLGLAGCASPAQIAAQDDSLCRSYGAQPGSQAYIQCRMAQDQRRDQHRREVAGALADGLAEVGRQRSQPSTRTTCTSQQTLPGMVETTCN